MRQIQVLGRKFHVDKPSFKIEFLSKKPLLKAIQFNSIQLYYSAFNLTKKNRWRKKTGPKEDYPLVMDLIIRPFPLFVITELHNVKQK